MNGVAPKVGSSRSAITGPLSISHSAPTLPSCGYGWVWRRGKRVSAYEVGVCNDGEERLEIVRGGGRGRKSEGCCRGVGEDSRLTLQAL